MERRPRQCNRRPLRDLGADRDGQDGGTQVKLGHAGGIDDGGVLGRYWGS
jgi:hypothetical protein